MEKTFQNKVVIVTGASSGIGRATAIALAARGAKVAVVDYKDASETLSLIPEKNAAVYIKCDVSREAEVKAMVEKTVQTFGGLDIAVNNAGTEGVSSVLQDMKEDDWNTTINIDLKGVWLCMKYEIPEMLRRNKGAIVNISSIAGVIGFQNAAAYVAAKHGVIGLTKVAALENALTGIRVNAICPGLIKTPMLERAFAGNPAMEQGMTNGVPMHRLGTADEISDSILHLASDASTLITGHALVIDGGWVAQ